jgi:dolichol-phosphate mannosyltransferase
MIYIVLPAHNEEDGIEKLLERICRIKNTVLPDLEVIVVNDGSSDHTSVVVKTFQKALPIELIDFESNRGVQEVFRVGLKRVCERSTNSDDICITMDSDNTHTPFSMLDIFSKMKECDVVIASRFCGNGGMVGTPYFRQLLSVAASNILVKFVPIKGVSDYSTFYRGYRIGMLKKGFDEFGDDFIKGEGFSGIVRLLLNLDLLGARFGEVPFTLKYFLKEGGSGMNLFKTTMGYLKIISEYRKKKQRINSNVSVK